MNRIENAVVVAAPPERIYRLASATERWPEYLPHYRFVRVLEERAGSRLVEMAASRDWIPIRWVAEQFNDPERPTIRFLHVRGWTRGMEVQWRFEPVEGGTRVTIEHRLKFRFPVAADWLGEHVVCKFFVDDVARKTLARIKALAEAAA
ncbi:MAG: type II toxin-antitoxin system RatA family toxin [Vulcanimicrobiaceae bacterium]